MNRSLLDAHFKALAEQSEPRQQKCWCYGCRRPALIWVKEVQFGLKEEVDHHFVSSKDYPGPVPGFCFVHQVNGPAELAQTIYTDRAEMQWGFRPKHWFVVFTDGTKTGGHCLSFEPPKILEEYIPASE